MAWAAPGLGDTVTRLAIRAPKENGAEADTGAGVVVEGAAERVLLVGVPDDVGNSTAMVDVIPFAGGTPRFWKPGIGGISAAGASRFGDALASVTI